jgi:hypothetical protein
MLKLERRIQLLLAIALSTMLTAAAQIPGPLTNNHPIVIDHLIHFYDGLASHIAARDVEDPGNAASRLLGARTIFGLSADGYQHLGIVLLAAKSKLDGLRSSQGSYQQQNAVLQGVSADLKAQLNPTDWSALQLFIQRELVGKIKVAPVIIQKR